MKVFYKDGSFYMNDNGNDVALTPNEDNYMKLPTNSCNRVWVSCKKVLAQPNQELDYGNEVRVPRVLGTVGPRKPDYEYLDENDQKLFKQLLEKIKIAKTAAHKPLSDLDKAKAKLERAKAQYEALMAATKESK